MAASIITIITIIISRRIIIKLKIFKKITMTIMAVTITIIIIILLSKPSYVCEYSQFVQQEFKWRESHQTLAI